MKYGASNVKTTTLSQPWRQWGICHFCRRRRFPPHFKPVIVVVVVFAVFLNPQASPCLGEDSATERLFFLTIVECMRSLFVNTSNIIERYILVDTKKYR